LKKKNLPQPLPSHTVSFDVNFCPVLSEVLTWSFRYEKLLILLPEIISEYHIFPILSFQDLYLHIFVQNLSFLTKNEDL